MKNLKIALKMTVGFGVAILMLIVVGLVGLFSLNSMNADYLEAVNVHGKPLVDTGHALADLHAARAEIRAAIIFSGDTEKVAAQYELVRQYMGDFEARSDYLGQFFTDEESQAFFAEAMSVYPSLTAAIDKIIADAKVGVEPATLAAFMMSDIKPVIDTIIGDVEGAMAIKSGLLDESVAVGTSLAQQMGILLPALIIVAVIGSVLIGLYTSRLIRVPLACLTSFMKRAGKQGDISVSPELANEVARYMARKDELGECLCGTDDLVKRITEVDEHMGYIADGDLTKDLPPLSEKDTMGKSLHQIFENLNEILADVANASSQVNTGAGQIASGAQQLASGSTEQAATAQEISAAIAEISTQAAENAASASGVANAAHAVAEKAEAGIRQMAEMTTAMKAIAESGHAISKIIKVIDEISFQTGILSINASVEAAHAGQHGKGFAVVAEEVKNLASKSAKAAKETADLIESAIGKSDRGLAIAEETSQSFTDITQGIQEIGQISDASAAASEAQSAAVSQVRQGVEQMTDVIQQNSATAEESAAASEELSSQSTLLRESVGQFKLKGVLAPASIPAPAKRLSASSSADYGKY